MNDPVGYNIVSYGIFLQREKRDFSQLLNREVLVTAIITCHPEDIKDFKKAYFVFIDERKIPVFVHPDHIRADDSGNRSVYIFRSHQSYQNYVDLLRYEKPITLWWSKRGNSWQLATGKAEPVGEAIE